MIVGYVGVNGSGKTALGVTRMLDVHRARPHRRIISTVPISHDGSVFTEELGSWTWLLEQTEPLVDAMRNGDDIEGFDLFIDEVSAFLPARNTMSLPPRLVLWLQMARHTDCTITWTAPSWSSADTLLRTITIELNELVPVFRRPAKVGWGDTLLSVRYKHNSSLFEGGRAPKDQLPKVSLVRVSKLPGIGAYPKRFPRPLVSEHLGYCLNCGGKTPPSSKACKC